MALEDKMQALVESLDRAIESINTINESLKGAAPVQEVEPAPAPEPDPAPAPIEEDGEVSLQDAQQVTIGALPILGPEKVVETLSNFSASKVQELDPADYAAYIAAIERQLNG